MDRKVSSDRLQRERMKKYGKYGIGILAVVILVLFVSNLLGTKLDREQLMLGKVSKGSLNITVSASGKVIPFSEEIIVAPITSRILEIYKNAGDTVEVGEPLLKLELASIETEYKQKLDEREMKRRKLDQVRITLKSNISELEMQEQVKEMQLKKMYTELQNEKYLDSIGASTADKIREIALNYDVSKLEHQQLKQKLVNEREKSIAEIRVQELEFSIFEKGLQENARLLQDARILSPQKATLTYINNQVGAQVATGSQVAIVSDLSRYKIEAELADSHANKLTAGGKAIVKTGNTEINGTVVNIVPSVKNGTVSFSIILNDNQYVKLRSGLSVDIYIEHGMKENVLRLPNGSFYSSAGEYELWVLNRNEAYKRTVMLGDSNYDFVEVRSGLQEGDEVILNNMDNYKNKESIKIQ